MKIAKWQKKLLAGCKSVDSSLADLAGFCSPCQEFLSASKIPQMYHTSI